MKKISLAVIGGGFNGQIGFIENFYKNKKCKIACLVEARKNLRIKVAKKFNIKKTYSTHHHLIKDIKNYDGIVIVTKRNMTAPLTYAFLKLKKPILTEKPIAGNYEQSKKLLKSSIKFKTPHKVGYNKIYDDGIIEAKKVLRKIIKNDTLGKIILVKSHRLSGSGYDIKNKYLKSNEENNLNKPSWPMKPKWLKNKFKNTYEKYLNLYCHNLSLFRYFTDEFPKVVYSSISDKRMSVVILKYKNFNAVLETGFFTKKGWDETFEIYFEHGSLKINLPPQHYKYQSAKFELIDRKKGKIYNFISKKTWSFKNQADAFINDVKLKKVLINNSKDAVKDMKLIELIWKKNQP